MDQHHYLQRIGVTTDSLPTLHYLAHLQEQHMFHVPFENLDVIKQTPIVLDTERFYAKVVNRFRGGFCYELNGLFHWLLKTVGYDGRLLAATVQKDDGTWALEGSHATNMVTIDGLSYLVDVGFGDSIRQPIPFSGEIITDISGSYRLTLLTDQTYDFQKQQNGKWKTTYRVSTVPKQLQDFQPMCEFNQTSPLSPFTKARLATIATKDGRITLSGSTLTITKEQDKKKIDLQEQDIDEVLDQYFHIQL
ncbi:arylamine N-acetyltransferase [Bacillus sp. CGMCC 1.16541]|uniref:arylamine N-acetyltransferase family protein n=1 Tax=Bacillus sp. CGMCC 1.16541 TaxID=2185143 RepID=UPI000D72A265|nr:arylamine N-acetyltransferase [Bacillus sp. CGMCC 1.16541]